MTRRLLAGLALTFVASCVLGVALDAEGFVVNMAATGAGTAAGVVIAVWLVQRLIERERAKQWALVSNQLKRSIIGIASDVAFRTYLEVNPANVDLKALNDDPSHEAWRPGALSQALRQLSDDVRQRADELGEPSLPTIVIRGLDGSHDVFHEGSSYVVEVPTREAAARRRRSYYRSASTATLLKAVHADLSQLRDVLLPRLLQLGADPALASALGDVEGAERRWRWAVEVVEDDWGGLESDAWKAAADLLQALATVVRSCGMARDSGYVATAYT